uniref:Hypothethical protein (Modular protein) n=1 Tax=Ralstonia solanacearum TaxID=305 RepID=A0A0S4TP78_RALSL|nr:Hypothethical protein (modular protein) [Ralstonia solanacearum]
MGAGGFQAGRPRGWQARRQRSRGRGGVARRALVPDRTGFDAVRGGLLRRQAGRVSTPGTGGRPILNNAQSNRAPSCPWAWAGTSAVRAPAISIGTQMPPGGNAVMMPRFEVVPARDLDHRRGRVPTDAGSRRRSAPVFQNGISSKRMAAR